MRATPDNDDAVPSAVQAIARRERRTAGAVSPDLARPALTAPAHDRGPEIAEPEMLFGLRPMVGIGARPLDPWRGAPDTRGSEGAEEAIVWRGGAHPAGRRIEAPANKTATPTTGEMLSGALPRSPETDKGLGEKPPNPLLSLAPRDGLEPPT